MILFSIYYAKVQNDDWLQADYCPSSKLSDERIFYDPIPGVKKDSWFILWRQILYVCNVHMMFKMQKCYIIMICSFAAPI
jgi:hypothetical protein